MTLNRRPYSSRSLLLVAVALLTVGCASVRPWQRGVLADRCMQFDPDAGRVALQAHWQEAREGSAGGFGIQGGGCGCK